MRTMPPRYIKGNQRGREPHWRKHRLTALFLCLKFAMDLIRAELVSE